MLNSRYAPVVALAILGVVLIAVLGWFLAINPQLSKASELASTADLVRANTQQIEEESARIDQYAALLAEPSDVPDSLALNAPSRIDDPGFRARFWEALGSSGVEIIEFDQGASTYVEGWTVEPNALTSNQLANLFQTGPVSTASGASEPEPAATADAGAVGAPVTGGWTPVVTPFAGESLVEGSLARVPFTLTVTGTPQEMFDFFIAMSLDEDPIFQVFEVEQVARHSDASSLTGVSDAQDGNIISTVTGVLYTLDPEVFPNDSGDVTEVSPRGDGFVEIGPADPQPGAN